MDSIFNKFLKENFAFFDKDKSAIGIDIGSAFLKVVQLKKKGGKAILETYGELALGPYAGLAVGQATNLSAEKISEALSNLFKESNVTTKNSGFSLPLRSSLLSFLSMPDLPEKQLAKMIPIEARKYIPVPISEVTLDWWIIPKDERGEISVDQKNKEQETDRGKTTKQKKHENLDVLVVAMQNEVIEKYNSIASQTGLKNKFMELEVFSTTRAALGTHTSSVMIFDIGAGSTKLSILEHGVIRSQHIIGRGSQDITLSASTAMGITIQQAEELKRKTGLLGEGSSKQVSEIAELSLEYVFSEANRVMLNYQRMHNKTISAIILSGGGCVLKGLPEFAKQKMGIEIILADPFSKIETPAFLSPLLKEIGPEFATSVGVALRKLQEME